MNPDVVTYTLDPALTAADVAHLRAGMSCALRFKGEGWQDVVTGRLTSGQSGFALQLGPYQVRDFAGHPSSLLAQVIAPKPTQPPPSPAGQVRRDPQHAVAGMRLDVDPLDGRPWRCTDGRDRSELEVKSWPILFTPPNATDVAAAVGVYRDHRPADRWNVEAEEC